MKLTILFLLTILSEAKLPSSDPLTVRTATGTFTGLIDPEFPNTRQFRAIPFAKPPVSSRRWLPPQKLSPSNKHTKLTQFPASCPQFVSAVPMFYNSDLTRGNTIYNPNPNGEQNDTSGLVGTATSEDCLYLAVWAPQVTAPRPKGGLPVLFFMTGGGFIIGGINIPWQMPTNWVERSQSHIIVTINYRVDIIGFPHARGLAKGQQNLGILDQRAALEWVRDNIAAFGGDPSRITQMGRSAGAVSTDVHAYAFREDPIAQAYYMQSGTIFGANIQAKDPTYSNFTFVARHFGCEKPDSDEDGKAELDCMRRVSFKDIINFVGQYIDSGESPALRFSLVPDNRIVFTNYKERSEAGNITRLPTMISNAANEASALFWEPNITTPPDQSIITALDVSAMVCPTFNSTVYRNRMSADVPVFRFQHAGTFPNLNYYPWLGAYHASEIPIFFGTYHLLDHVAPTTQFEIDVSRSMQDHILAFVKDPYHGPQRTMGWKPMIASDPNGGDLLRFGPQGVVSQHVDGIEVDGVCLGLREYNPFP
ncbi:fatty acyl-CoA hydrolase [Amniculicola lignicola CBS 123094]|uniref:Fatty acyl-CoA hydrolase n=1 Tax=Amniculicola lignicola CBS 123094 TaxID=1392246 RepID=A0A6A5WFH4_9PLEO|nr:fatty acyl-CoA hydrolase [Amniculicola lignicola CBS 123094]